MYNRYKQTAIQGLPTNQQIAAVLSDLQKELKESDELFRNYEVAKSIEIGEKAIYKAIALSDIVDKLIDQTLEKPNHTEDMKKALNDLKEQFDIMHKTVGRYVVARNPKLFESIIKNLEIMEKFWRSIKVPVEEKPIEIKENKAKHEPQVSETPHADLY